ncbi:MAG TPA: YicC/YloC family endoribonuclease [Xanthobacteraceae bacterium]|nr:YicC/YloC family endoribonuclease [Xanthobacteraceae bacterium]
MALISMTGFARTQGAAGAWSWAWELKSVNGKGLDVRLRLPSGFDVLEPGLRQIAAGRLSRGNVTANLTATRTGAPASVRVNEALLHDLIGALSRAATASGLPLPGIDAVIGFKGVVEVSEHEETEAERRAAEASVIAGFETALAQLVAMRAQEGAALARVLEGRLDAVARLAQSADACPARRPEAIRQKLAEQIRVLLDTGAAFDPDRLHQEALMLAAKADVREELDRLSTHVAAARALIGEGGPVGRRLDFLAQEFNRETNTLCSKANDVTLTAIGLELKGVVEQFREQVQNIE